MSNTDQSIKLFISYAHEDEAFLVQLEKHLSSLKRENLVSTWYDRRIQPGEKWEKQIDQSLETADIALFLVSPDFVASEYCQGREVKLALEKHERKELIVVPLVIRPVDWLHTPLGAIQGIPKDGKAISTWEDRDLGWLDCIHRLRPLVHELIARGNPKKATSKRLQRFGLQEALTAAVEELDFRYNSDAEIGGIPTGLHDLDRLIDGLHSCDVISIASPNPSDKTDFLVNIVNYAATEAGLPAVLFSTRHTKEDISRRLMAICGHLSPHSLQRGAMLDEDWPRLTHAIQKLNEATLAIYDESEIHIDSLEEEIKAFSKDAGRCALVAIDSFENIVGESKSETLRRLSRLAKSLKTTIVACTELDRDITNRPNKRPVLGDLGHISQFWDFILFVYRDEVYNPDTSDRGTAEVIVAKNPRGAVGTIRASHVSWTGKFSNFIPSSSDINPFYDPSTEGPSSEARRPRFELLESFPKDDAPIPVDDIKKIYLKFSNPIDRNTACFIGVLPIPANGFWQWDVNGGIQFAENNTKLIWRITDQLYSELSKPTGIENECYRFEIHIGRGHPENSVKDIYGNSLPQMIIPVFIKILRAYSKQA